MIMTKKYSEAQLHIVHMHADIIATSVGLNNKQGSVNPLVPDRRRASIWE